eukprot:12366857-Karenia_brevis.AAC.1
MFIHVKTQIRHRAPRHVVEYFWCPIGLLAFLTRLLGFLTRGQGPRQLRRPGITALLGQYKFLDGILVQHTANMSRISGPRWPILGPRSGQ